MVVAACCPPAASLWYNGRELDLSSFTLRGYLRTILFTIREVIHDVLSNFYWHFLSISYCFEIFDFKVFWVWTWPSNLRNHLRSKIFSLFEYLYKHDFLTNFHWHLFLYLAPFSRYRISQFLEFYLDLRPLKVIWGWKIYIIRKPIYDFLFGFYGPSLYIVPFFSRYSTSRFLGFDLDLWRSSEVKHYNIRKLMTSYSKIFLMYTQNSFHNCLVK